MRVEKLAALYTSRDRGISEPLEAASRSAARYPGFDEAVSDHARAWDELWEVCDLRLPRDQRVQFLLRFHVSHVLQACSRLTAHHDAGVPGTRPPWRGLPRPRVLGRAVRVPVPEPAAARHHAEPAAVPVPAHRRGTRGGAQAAGYRGAMYPWQSGSDGARRRQKSYFNPRSGGGFPTTAICSVT